MKITYPYNGWTPVVECDVKNLSDEEIQQLGVLLAKQIMFVIRGQKLTPLEEVAFTQRFGTLENKAITNVKNRKAITVDGLGVVSRVTGKLNEDGMPGIHGHASDLDWHCDRAWDRNRQPILYLYSVEGSRGSRTTYANYVMAYHLLLPEWRDRLKKLKVKTAQTYSKYSEMGKYFGVPDQPGNWHVDMITKNSAGQPAIFFPWNQMEGIAEVSAEEEQEITDYLKTYLTQEKFIYDHYWEDGDIVMADQWSGMHKRWAFDKMDERVLHCIILNYNNIVLPGKKII
jgi:taurine dioxygenase